MDKRDTKINIQIQRESCEGSKSKLRQYQDLVVGSRSFWFLLKFELVNLFTTRVPGALGIFLRRIFYPLILGEVGAGVVFGMDVWFRHPMKIRVGAGVILDDGALLDAKGTDNDGIRLGDACYIGRGSVLSCKQGDIVFGDYVNLSTWCNISSNSKIVIGEKTLLGPYVSLFATEHKFDDVGVAILDQGWTSKGITLGANCWLGAGVSALDGVSIGDNTIVGAGAVVTDDLPANIIAVGAPARKVKDRQ